MIGSSVLSIQQLQYLCNLQLTFYLTCFSQFLFSLLLHVAASLCDPLPSPSNWSFSGGTLKNACLLLEPNRWLRLGQGQPLAVRYGVQLMIYLLINDLFIDCIVSIYKVVRFLCNAVTKLMASKIILKLNQIRQKNESDFRFLGNVYYPLDFCLRS